MRIQPLRIDVPWVYLCLQVQHKEPGYGARLELPAANDSRTWPGRAWPCNDRRYEEATCER